MVNRYGVDVSYFSKELKKLDSSLNDRFPAELARYLRQLACIADENGRTKLCSKVCTNNRFCTEYKDGNCTANEVC